MPWSASDAKGKTSKADTPAKQKKWAEIANNARKKALSDGKSEDEADASAIKIANSAVANIKEDESTVRHGRIQEAATRQSGAVEVVTEDNGETTVLKNVLLVGKSSRNKADYPDQALHAGLKLYEDTDVFVGHTKDGSNPIFDRNMGVTRNPHVAADGIRGDHAFPSTHRLAEDLKWRAKHAPRNLGYSHDADCTWNYDSKGRKQVASIDRVFSVDLVTRPATTGGLAEDEESIPDDQRDMAEHFFSAFSDCRSIILSDGTRDEKVSRLLEEIQTLRGELFEGEIADEMAKDEPRHKMSRIRNTAERQLDETMWGSDKYPQHHDKRQRHLSILADWSKELKGVQCNCPECCGKSTNTKEEINMTPDEVTADWLKANKPDLVAKLTGTDEHTRLTEEVKTLKATSDAKDVELATLKAAEAKRIQEQEITAELTAMKFPINDPKVYTSRFKEELLRAKDKAERTEIAKERMALISGRVQEDRLPSPLSEFRDAPKSAAGANPSHDRFFGVKK